jgi:hypothetical protein
MGFSRPSGNATHSDAILANWPRSRRRFIETHIVLRTLTAISALILMPLLAWHQATNHLVDHLGMPHIWVEDVRKAQGSTAKTWLWVSLWVLVCVRSEP